MADDVAYDHGAGSLIIREPKSDAPPSRAAAAMKQHCLRRGGRRGKVPMTEAAQVALLDYYREQIELIKKTRDLLDRDDSLYPDRSSFIIRHAKACEKLCQSLAA